MPTRQLESKTITRKFNLENSLLYPNLKRWADEVIDSIEKDKLLVFDPKDEDALRSQSDENGAELILSGAKMPISIKEWLCVGCQCIRYKDRRGDGKAAPNEGACYQHNGAKVLWPEHPEWEPEGPAAFVGEILISPQTQDKMTSGDDISTENKFKWIVAHELVHVFDIMRFVVPAFMDWRNFWERLLDEGCSCDILQSRFHAITIFVDCYGEENELAMIEEYWPSQAKIWFDAIR